MVASIAFCGMGMFSSKEIRCGESLMYEGGLGTKGLIMWSMTRSVGPLQPLTMGLIPWGVLWSFLRKYTCCVPTFSEYGYTYLCSQPLSYCLLVLLCCYI